jgi:hypothetical protein
MPGVSQYERLLIDALLMSKPYDVEDGAGLFVMPAEGDAKPVFDHAVLPAMRRNALNGTGVRMVFDDLASLADVCRFVQIAEVIVIDVSDLNASVLYVLGLCHGLGRCPIVLTRDTAELPFNLRALRGVEYKNTLDGMFELRERLERVLRVFLLASRAGHG